jgi:hypothetical protein
MSIKAYVYATIQDKEGKKIYRVRKRAKSFVKAFIGILARSMLGSTSSVTVPVIDTGGTARSTVYPQMHTQAGVGDTSYGIVVGSVATAVTIDDYKLGGLIPHGTVTGQLQYGGMSIVGTFIVSGNKASIKIGRTLTNPSSTDAVVFQEVGLYVYDESYKYCIDRTLFTGTIPPSGNAQIIYEIAATV